MLFFVKLSRIIIITFCLNLILSFIPDYIVAQNASNCSQVQRNNNSSECNRQANITALLKKQTQQSKKQSKEQKEISRSVRNFINSNEPEVTTEKPPEVTAEKPPEEEDAEKPEKVQKIKSAKQVVRERRGQEEKELFRRLVEASKSRNVSNKGRKGRRTYGLAIEPYKRP